MAPATAAFLAPAPLPAARPPRADRGARRGVCRALMDGQKPPLDGAPSNNDALSATDREYLAKVRARLFNARRRADAASGGASSDAGASPRLGAHERLDPADLPDDLDAMEDILFDRAPVNKEQVRLFGAWLDETVAGRKADQPPDAAAAAQQRPESADSADSPAAPTEQDALDEAAANAKKATQLFRSAMALFNKGRYPRAAEAFAGAATLVGPATRLGGQYGLWHAQARDAAGEKGAAERLLTTLSTHDDGDVRKVAAELHFIITAPKLELDPGSFMEIPTLDESVSPNMQGVLLSNFGPLPTAFVEKPPEPYSLQWYLAKKPAPKVQDHSVGQAVAVTAAIIGTLAYMVASPHI